MIPSFIQCEITQLASSSPQEETCGIILDGDVIPSKNIAKNPALDFELEDAITNLVLEAIEAGKRPTIYHSHVNSNNDFSVADIKTAKAWNLPIYLHHLHSGFRRYYDPLEELPYVGREWHWSYQNCYTLIQSFYQKEFNILLADFYLDHPTAWEEPGWNLYLENIQSQGFQMVPYGSEMKYGDLILIPVGSSNINHGAIFWKPEENKILHHLADKLSGFAPYGGYYRKMTHSVWRQKSL